MLIATLLIVCLMACACGTTPAESAAPSSSEAASTQAPASQAPTSQAPASQAPASQAPASQAPTSVTPAPNPGAETWMDFSALATSYGKGTEFSCVEGIFTITRGKGTTSSGKTVKEGTKAGTSFTGGVQLGKNGTATDKCIAFTVPAGCTSIEVYANCGSTGVTAGGYTVQVNGTANALTCPNANIACGTVTVAGGDSVVIFGGADGSINVWGILVK